MMSGPDATPGNGRSTASRSEAEQWVGIYEELLRFERGMVETMKQRLQQLSGPAREEVRRHNLSALEADLRRYQERLRVWRTRLDEIDQA